MPKHEREQLGIFDTSVRLSVGLENIEDLLNDLEEGLQMCDTNENRNLNFETKAIHAGQDCHQWSYKEIVPPIVNSVTFYQKDPTDIFGVSQGTSVLILFTNILQFGVDFQDYCYSRDANPTRKALENCLAALDNGKHGLVFPSDCATTTAVLHLLKPGEHILSCSETSGKTRTIFLTQVKMQGIEVDFVDSTDVEFFASAIKPNTRVSVFKCFFFRKKEFYCEPREKNPSLELTWFGSSFVWFGIVNS